MALFGGARDISMFRKVNRELLGDIITQQVAIYKYVLDKTKVNMYGESSGGKFFTGPILLNALIEVGDNTSPTNEFGVDFNCYYGCASLGRESQIVVNNDRLELDGKPVKAYHFARGGITKPHPTELFSQEVVNFIYQNIVT